MLHAKVMERLNIECLRCGDRREVTPSPRRHREMGDCPRCGYLGWAESDSLTERARKALRDRPVEVRRLRLIAG